MGDDFDELLAERLEDPAFRTAYEAAQSRSRRLRALVDDPSSRPWLTSHEVAEFLGESVDTVWRWARSGTGPVKPLRLGERQIRWPTMALLRAVGLIDPPPINS